MTELYASATCKIASDIITPIFKTAAVFLKAHNFPQATDILLENCLLLGTDNVLRQISNYTFAPKVGFCLFVILVVNHDQLSFRFNYSIVCLSVTHKLCSNSVCNFCCCPSAEWPSRKTDAHSNGSKGHICGLGLVQLQSILSVSYFQS